MLNGLTLRVPVSGADHSLGHENALLEVVEYGDYECQGCGQATDAFRHLRDTLKGNLRFVFRNLPLTELHPHALDAAKAAEAAALQGQFWEMHDLLYEHQDELEPERLVDYAEILGLDLIRFRQDMASEVVEKRIQADADGARASGIDETPALFINGLSYSNEHSFEQLLQALRDLRWELLMRKARVAA